MSSFQPEDLFALRSASDAQPSPDGSQVVFVMTELDRAADRSRASICSVAMDEETRRLAEGSMPRWSPNGSRLACVSDRQICILSTDGGDPVPLTDLPGGVTGPPVWSADGTHIAFTARVAAAPAAALAPREIRRLRYLLNGEGFVGDSWWHVFSVASDGTSPPRQITTGDWHHFSPAWSPDGSHLACVTTRRDDWDTEWIWDVYLLDAQNPSATPRRLTDSSGTCAAPAWSPDGKWIAYFDNHCTGTAYAQDYYLCLVPAGGGDPIDVSRALDRGCQISQPPAINEPARWSADSSTVFFHVREGGFYHYYAYDPASRNLRLVRGTLDVDQPIDGWVRQSTDGHVWAFAAATGRRPAEVYTCGPDEAPIRQLTHLNDGAMAGLDLRLPARRTHLSPEEWQVESWLWLPPSYASGDPPLPAVLYFHGGPHNTVSIAFNEQLHLLAAAGFAVLGVNFRGSTGFGAAFADSILRDWGPRELEDGSTAIDQLIGEGIVDARRVGVYGSSYGGFMTNLALARTDRFAAGVSGATISGLHTFSNITDHWESVDWDSGGSSWEIPDYYSTHSPLTYVADITAPLLILHGEADFRCSVTEADQLFGALRKLKRTVELVRYPGSSHAFAHTGPPSHRFDAARRVVDWFVRYVANREQFTS
jgi:dipeptidyl aminopeptidase/acylaminoacyl peptidase